MKKDSLFKDTANGKSFRKRQLADSDAGEVRDNLGGDKHAVRSRHSLAS
jgi:hypothetical protein